MTTIGDVQDALLNQYGLWPGDGWREALPRALHDISRAACVSESELMDRVLSDASLLRDIAGRVTVPESFFFRHPEQLELVCNYIAKKAKSVDAPSSVRIWSAGCSQGEEPYSLAILLRERLSAQEAERVSIFANDINGDVVSTAKEGIYSTWSFRGMDAVRRQAYFEPLDERRFRLAADIRAMVSFRHGSIQEQLQSVLPSSVDLLMFRNVAIYLSESALTDLYERFCRVLVPGGLLCLSSSDPPVYSDALIKLEEPSFSIYQKQTAPADTTAVFSTGMTPQQFSWVKPAARTDAAPSSKGSSHFSTGRFRRTGHREPSQKIRTVKTEADYRKAMFEEPQNLMARFWYAVTLFEGGAQNRCVAQMNALVDDLNKMDDTIALGDGETTVGELRRTVRAFLEKVS